MPITLLDAGDNSATWLMKPPYPSEPSIPSIGPADFANLPNGRLKQFLTVDGYNFPPVFPVGDADFQKEFARLGGVVTAVPANEFTPNSFPPSIGFVYTKVLIQTVQLTVPPFTSYNEIIIYPLGGSNMSIIKIAIAYSAST